MSEFIWSRLGTATANGIALTMVHFLWQGAFIALVVWMIGALLHKKSANVRYAVYLGGLVAMAVAALVTLGAVTFTSAEDADMPASEPARVAGPPVNNNHFVSAGVVAEGQDPPAQVSSVALSDQLKLKGNKTALALPSRVADSRELPALPANANLNLWQKAAPFVTAVYLLGVLLLLVRLMLGLRGGWRLRRHSQPIDDASVLGVMASCVQALGMRVSPALRLCRDIAVPTVVGVIRPTILLPLSLIAGLNPRQLESILTHELAHIRRHDHLVNILQRIIEAVLFFHPAVWWISHRICIERENCCDDVVLRLGAEPARYAELLVDLVEHDLRSRPAHRVTLVAALQATAGRSQVSQRVRRLLGVTTRDRFRLSRSVLVGNLAVAVILFTALMTLSATPGTKTTKEDARQPQAITAKSPRQTVADFLSFIKSSRSRDAWALTAPNSHAGWGPELTKLREYDSIRPLHQANTKGQAIVVSNRFRDNHGRQSVFQVLLRKHEGKWLIDRHDILAPDNAFREMKGFKVHPSVRFDVIPAELVGRWRVNVCAASLSLGADGSGTELQEGPNGPKPGAKPVPFKWTVKGNTLTRSFANRNDRLNIHWLDESTVHLTSTTDGGVRNWHRVGGIDVQNPPKKLKTENRPQYALNDITGVWLAPSLYVRHQWKFVAGGNYENTYGGDVEYAGKWSLKGKELTIEVSGKKTSYQIKWWSATEIALKTRKGDAITLWREKHTPNNKKPAGGGPIIPGLKVSISFTKPRFTTNVPINVKWQIKNVSNKPRTVVWHPLHYSPVLFVVSRNGQKAYTVVDYRRFFNIEAPAPPELIVLQPGAAKEATFDLRHFGLEKDSQLAPPGEFTITGLYAPKAKQAIIPGDYLKKANRLGAVLERIESVPAKIIVADQSADEKDAVRALQKLGGQMTFNRDGQAEIVDLQNLKINDDALKPLQELKAVRYVNLHSTGVTDAGLAHLQHMKELVILSLWNTKVSDKGLIHLKNLKKLRELNIGMAKVDGSGLAQLNCQKTLHWLNLGNGPGVNNRASPLNDAGLASLKTFTELRKLGLDSTKVTSMGMQHLAGLTKLTNLSIARTSVTDNGLEHLKSLKKLHTLDITGTAISNAGIEQLRALPDLRVLYYGQTNVTQEATKRLLKLHQINEGRGGRTIP